jgi:EAL domain-containing protein (putative c-di-GMP-specific phosphodiesterase class I)
MTSNQEPKVGLIGELRDAIFENELRVFYQPIYRLADVQVKGFEALVRWQHPKRGLLLPHQFVPHAEKTAVIADLDRWVMHTALPQLCIWNDFYSTELEMSINISSRDFAYCDLIAELRLAITRSNLTGSQVRVELTESQALERSEHSMSLIALIREMGVRIDVDDFGTGYSSLEVLQYLCVDALKIDRTFVANMSSQRGIRLVESMIVLAHNLDMTAIAEGIERQEQADQLAALDCDHAQGYLFSRPLSAADATELLNMSYRPSMEVGLR